MAQTTGAISFSNVKVELSTDGVSWTDVSGFFNNVKIGGGKVAVGEYGTSGGVDTPIIKRGKKKSLTVTIECAYTETVSEPWDMANTAYANMTDLYARWSPKGGSSGQKRHTTSAGIVTDPVYPVGDVDKGDIVKTTIVLQVASITPSTIP